MFKLNCSKRFLRLILHLILFSVWIGSLCLIYFFARDWMFTFFDCPFSYWLASHGIIGLFVAIVVIYAFCMNRWEKQEQIFKSSYLKDSDKCNE